MANNIKGITLEIGGETTKLSKALSGVNSEIKGTQSQLKEVEKLLKLDPTNTELLRQKQVLLGQAVGESGSKLETLRKAEEQLKTAGVDENSEQFMALKREIIATEESMTSLKGGAEKSTKATKEQGEAAEEASEKNSGLSTVLAGTGAAFTAAATAAAAAAVKIGTAMVESTTEGAEYADTVLTESTVTGIATDKLQAYMYAAELVDVSTETLTGSMAKNIRAMKDAADGSSTYVEAYERLGVAVTDSDGNLRDSETVYWEVIEALGSIENETERDAVAMEILGKSAQDLNPLIEAGADRMAELSEQAQESGYVMSEDTLSAYGAFDDNLQYLSNGCTAAKNAIGSVLLPVLTDLSGEGVDLLTQFTNAILDGDGDIGQIVQNLAAMIPGILDTLMQYVPMIVEIVGEALKSVVTALVDYLPQIMPALKDLLLAVADIILDPEILGGLLDAAIDIALAVIDAVIDALPALLERLPEILERLMSAIVEKLPDLIKGLLKAAVALFKANINILKSGFSFIKDIAVSAVEALKPIFEKGGEFFQGITDGISKVFKKIVNGLIGGINKVIAVPFNAINAVLEKIRNIKLFGSQPFADLIKTINVPEIPMLARGGTVSNGMAIVGEAGPELLTVGNGRTTVTPLTARIDSGDLAAISNRSINIQFTGSLAQLARVLQPAIVSESGRLGTSLIGG